MSDFPLAAVSFGSLPVAVAVLRWKLASEGARACKSAWEDHKKNATCREELLHGEWSAIDRSGEGLFYALIVSIPIAVGGAAGFAARGEGWAVALGAIVMGCLLGLALHRLAREPHAKIFHHIKGRPSSEVRQTLVKATHIGLVLLLLIHVVITLQWTSGRAERKRLAACASELLAGKRYTNAEWKEARDMCLEEAGDRAEAERFYNSGR